MDVFGCSFSVATVVYTIWNGGHRTSTSTLTDTTPNSEISKLYVFGPWLRPVSPPSAITR